MQLNIGGVLGLAGRHTQALITIDVLVLDLGLAGAMSGKLQVHGGDQSPLPQLWISFVGTGIHKACAPCLKSISKESYKSKHEEILRPF